MNRTIIRNILGYKMTNKLAHERKTKILNTTSGKQTKRSDNFGCNVRHQGYVTWVNGCVGIQQQCNVSDKTNPQKRTQDL